LCTLGALCTARCRHCSPPTDTNFQAGKPAPPPYPADPSSAFFGNSLPRRLNFTSALFITDTAFCSAVRRPANLQISDPHLRCERSSVHLISCWFLPVHRNFIRRHAAAVSLMQGLMSPSWPVRSVSHARGHKNPKTVLIAPPRPAPAADRTPASGPHAAANCVKRSTSRAPLIQTAKFSELSVRSRVSGSASPDVPQTATSFYLARTGQYDSELQRAADRGIIATRPTKLSDFDLLHLLTCCCASLTTQRRT
jgi:hypothetical protein